MNQLKKTILTLVALLALTTGAWADDTYTVQFKANGNTKTVANVVLPYQFRCNFSSENGELDQIIRELYGWSGGYCNGDLHSSGNENVTCGSSDMDDYITISAPFEGTATVTGWYFNKSTNIKYSLEISIPGYVAKVNVTGVTLSETSAEMTLGGETLTLTATVAPANATNKTVTWTTSDESVATVANGVVTAVAPGTATITATATNGTADTSDDKTAACTVTVIQPGPEVAWDKATKTGTFTMPGGNVTLEPEYYPQAALTAAPTAINDVPATTDGAIVKAGTVANIGSTETAQGTVMYYVSQTALDDAALLALAADQWTADVPTAEKLAKGEAYVYYYVRGNDSDTDEENFSDGDILSANALTVTIAAEPTYDVTYAEGTQDADKWTVKAGTDGSFQSLPLKGVKAGTKVKLKYDGDRSMLKGVTAVKVEKKAAPATITVTWNNDDITGSGNSFTKGDVTITADMIDFHQKDFMMGGTFTTTLGNFTKIEVTGSKWDASGTGWSGSTWTGNASSVSYNGSIRGDGMGTIKFVFTIEAKKAAYEHSITIAVDPSTTGHIATAPAMTIEFNTGETWADVAARYDWLDTYDIYTVFYKDKDNILNGNVYDANGGVTPDKTIDPNGSYHWGPQ